MGEFRRSLYALLETGSQGYPPGRVFDVALIVVIIVSVLATAMETVPGISVGWLTAYHWIELVVVALFTVEYLARVWVSIEDPRAVGVRPWVWRLRHMVTPFAIVDLIVILPTYIELFLGGAWEFTLILRALRLIKLTRFAGALDTLGTVIHSERRSLIATACIIAISLLLISTFAYVAEREAQPDKFGSIPVAFYWGIITLATQGYSDISPMTPLGRAIGALGSVLGILTFAMPAGIIASGYMEELRRRDFIVTWQIVAKVPLFRHLTAARIASVALVLKPLRVKAGATVVHRGEEADGMYFITSGELLVEAPGHEVTLRSGDFFGEMGLLEGGRRSTTVRALTGCTLLHLGAAEFRQLVAAAPDLDAEVRRVANARRRDNESSTAERTPA
jgi:voltage-gated potassium channel